MATKMAAHGYDDKLLMKGIYAGMHAMINNDGSCTNEEAFWNTFTGILGEKVKEDMPIFDDFYRNEFQDVKNICGFLPEAAQTVRKLKEM